MYVCAHVHVCMDNFYTIILLKSFAVSKLQFLLDRLGRCLKLFVSTDSTSSHEFASQFGQQCFIREKRDGNRVALAACVYLNEAATVIDLSHTGGAPPSNARENEDVCDTNAWQHG